MKNTIILQPGDYIQLHYGLKIENVGNMVIEFELPYNAKIFPVKDVEIIDITYEKSN